MTTDHPKPSKPRRRWFQFSLRSLFWLTAVVGFYAWLFITIEPLLKPSYPLNTVMTVCTYAILTVVTVLMFWTKGKVIIGVAMGFFLFNLPFFAIYPVYYYPAGAHDVGNVLLRTGLLLIGLHGAGLGGGIDAIIRKHRTEGWTAIHLTSVRSLVKSFR